MGCTLDGKPCSGVKVEDGYKLSGDQVGAATKGGFCQSGLTPQVPSRIVKNGVAAPDRPVGVIARAPGETDSGFKSAPVCLDACCAVAVDTGNKKFASGPIEVGLTIAHFHFWGSNIVGKTEIEHEVRQNLPVVLYIRPEFCPARSSRRTLKDLIDHAETWQAKQKAGNGRTGVRIEIAGARNNARGVSVVEIPQGHPENRPPWY